MPKLLLHYFYWLLLLRYGLMLNPVFNQKDLCFYRQNHVINQSSIEAAVLMASANVRPVGRDNNAKIAAEEFGRRSRL